MNVMIVEDDPVACRIVEATLKQGQHTLLTARDGIEALEKIAAHKIDVIVSDWMMPRMDGIELCRQLRLQKRRSYIYFIMLTARIGQENFRMAMEAGVDDFLNKPMRRIELRSRLRVAERILSYVQQLRELRQLLPICSYCKRIRDDRDYWHQVESYLRTHAKVDFSHGICPDCYQSQVVPQLEALSLGKPNGTPGT